MKNIANVIIVASIALSSGAAYAKKGLTWTKRAVDELAGVVTVGCGYTPGVGNQCNPYKGDTPCKAKLPVLCFYPGEFPKPAHVNEASIYHTWSGGIVGTTTPVRGSEFDTLEEVDKFCVKHFGKGWRTAEHHDGWGWNFIAYGNVGTNYDFGNRRFWININDQANGTCWEQQ